MSLNTHLFTEIGTDSGAINVLGTVVTPFEDTDTYRLDLFRNGRFITHRTLVVTDDTPANQVNLDLATLPELQQERVHDRDCQCDAHETLEVRENGYLVLYVSQGPGGFAAVAYRPEVNNDEPAFDSRVLDEGAYFSALLLRPGQYVARNKHNQATYEFAIPRPERPEDLEIPDEPVRVTLSDQGFVADEEVVQPGQGLVFEIQTTARIIINLVESDENPDRDRPNGRTVADTHTPGSLFDPADYDIAGIERRLQIIESPQQLKILQTREERGQNRDKVKQLIETRQQELESRPTDGPETDIDEDEPDVA